MAPNPVPPLDLKIPASEATVSVRIINTTTMVSGIPMKLFATPVLPHFTIMENIPAFSFLIEHSSNRKVLFDLGVRKDFENSSPGVAKKLVDWNITVEKGVREQLEENGVSGEGIEAIIWSHWHWDHTGDPSTFPSSTALVVGPGFKSAFLPGYPKNPESPILESSFAGRELREISFEHTHSKIGNFRAFDYFGDGSFYLLDSPGHAIGHMCGLARVKHGAGGDHFILMGGDACHHAGEFRPSKYLPLPDEISPNPFHNKQTPCPGAIFEKLLRDEDPTKPFFTIPDGVSAHHDSEVCRESIEKVIEADGNSTVLTVIAHDESLLDVVDFFPKYADEFLEKGWREKGKWAFLKDFEKDAEK